MDSTSTGVLFAALLLSGLFLLNASSAWLRVSDANGAAPSGLKRAASFSGIALGTLGLTVLFAAFLL